jgi:hypothetical protein
LLVLSSSLIMVYVSTYVQSWSLIALSIGIVPDSIVRIVSLTNIGSIDDDELAVKWVGSCITFTNPFTDNTSLT